MRGGASPAGADLTSVSKEGMQLPSRAARSMTFRTFRSMPIQPAFLAFILLLGLLAS
jgi:hypothetical protein